MSAIQGLGDPEARCTLAWFVGRQPFAQLELWHHTVPRQRPLRSNWRPCDLGWARFGVAVSDITTTVEHLARIGVNPLGEPLRVDDQRRVAIQEPGSRTIIELFEDPGSDRTPAIVYAALSVSDLEQAHDFFCNGIGLQQVAPDTLHSDVDEQLWGLEDVRAERLVLTVGDAYVEVVKYTNPLAASRPADALASDQGMMNIAVGYRDRGPASEVLDRLTERGYRANYPLPERAGGTYVNDAQGNTLELLICPPEFESRYGFKPRII